MLRFYKNIFRKVFSSV